MKKIFLFVVALAAMLLVGCSQDGSVKITYISEGAIAFTDEVDMAKYFLPSQKLTNEDGLVFAGWYLDADFTYPMAFNAGATSDLTLYAKWVSIEDAKDELDPQDLFELIEQAQTAMLAKANKSIVMIDIIGGEWEGSGGSGVIYQKIDNTYYVLTNHHVTEGTKSSDFQITVFNGTTKKQYGNITKVHELKLKDLAILKFTTPDSIPVIEFEDAVNIKKGSFVYAIGSPVWFEDIITQGVVSYPKRNDADGEGFDADVLMHTAAINPGNS